MKERLVKKTGLIGKIFENTLINMLNSSKIDYLAFFYLYYIYTMKKI